MFKNFNFANNNRILINKKSIKAEKSRNIYKRKCVKQIVLMSFIVLICFSLFTTACKPTEGIDETKTSKTTASFNEKLSRKKVAVIMSDSSSSKTGSAAYSGLQMIANRDVEVRYVEFVPLTAAEKISTRLIKAGYDLIFFDSLDYLEIAEKIAAKNPRISFIIDSKHGVKTKADNLRCMTFRENEQNFLLGACTAIFAPSDSIGLIAKYPEEKKEEFSQAFVEGAKFVKPSATVYSSLLKKDDNCFTARASTEKLIDEHEISIVAVIAGEASKGAMISARKAGMDIVSGETNIKLLQHQEEVETTSPSETTESNVTETSSSISKKSEMTWAPGAVRPTLAEDDPHLYDPAQVKVICQYANAYLYAYELFQKDIMPAGNLSFGVKEDLIKVVDIKEDVSKEQIADIKEVINLIKSGSVTIP